MDFVKLLIFNGSIFSFTGLKVVDVGNGDGGGGGGGGSVSGDGERIGGDGDGDDGGGGGGDGDGGGGGGDGGGNDGKGGGDGGQGYNLLTAVISSAVKPSLLIPLLEALFFFSVPRARKRWCKIPRAVMHLLLNAMLVPFE